MENVIAHANTQLQLVHAFNCGYGKKLDEVELDIMNYQNQGQSYTDTKIVLIYVLIYVS